MAEEGESLFEGMVLLSPPPLDEDLFSDLTVLSPTSSVTSSETTTERMTERTTSAMTGKATRKKKKAIRIGYGRESYSEIFVKDAGKFSKNDAHELPSIEEGSSNPPGSTTGVREIIEDKSSSKAEVHEQPSIEEQTGDSPGSATGVREIISEHQGFSTAEVREQPMIEEPRDCHETVAGFPETITEDGHLSKAEGKDIEEDDMESTEKELDKIRAEFTIKLSEIKKTVASLAKERKTLRDKKRNTVESVSSAVIKHRELEQELEAACEIEDFERAESISERLAMVEKDKDDQQRLLQRTEDDCDALDLKIHEIVELQISTEEEFVALLEKFSKDAGDRADQIATNASEIHSKETEEWEAAMEMLESRRLETEFESNLVEEARLGLAGYIDGLTEADQKEKEVLTKQGIVLDRELEELQELVRQKRSQIIENKMKIQKVEERISKAVSEFHDSQSSIIAKGDDFLLVLSEIASENAELSRKKEEMDEFLGLAEKKSLRLKELSRISVEEAKARRDLIRSRQTMSSEVLKVREDKARLVKIEEQKKEEILVLRQQISTARSSLQELSSTRAKIQEELTLLTQRIGFIDKRVPELESEKKTAAAARNFREAGRVAAEAKSLSLEKEEAQIEVNKKVDDLKRVEEEIGDVGRKIEEGEGLVLLKEEEAAKAGWERLCLIAATASAEQAAAADAGDSEDEVTLLLEAEAASSKARELQERYGFSIESPEKASRCILSISMIINLSTSEVSAEKNDR